MKQDNVVCISTHKDYDYFNLDIYDRELLTNNPQSTVVIYNDYDDTEIDIPF